MCVLPAVVLLPDLLVFVWLLLIPILAVKKPYLNWWASGVGDTPAGPLGCLRI